MSGKLIQVRNSPIHGRGIFAIAPIKKGTRLIEYKGKRIDHKEADRLYSGGAESGHTFLFTLNDDYVIDANQEGNAARWINHSCAPNCESVMEDASKGDSNKKDRVFIEATRNIKPGEELTYNYLITLEEPHTARLKKIWACLCGAKNCSGTMLAKKR